MKAGQGKAKGSEWERQVGKMLSMWLTYGARPDIFSRNVLSGGTFTLAQNKGQSSSHMPGDLMAAHPLAFDFLSQYLIECKHLASLGLENYLFDRSGKGEMTKIVALAASQAEHAGLDFMLIAKQNYRDPLVIIAGHVGKRMLGAHGRDSRRVVITPNHHYLHKSHIMVMWLSEMLTYVKPRDFLDPPRLNRSLT